MITNKNQNGPLKYFTNGFKIAAINIFKIYVMAIGAVIVLTVLVKPLFILARLIWELMPW